MAWIIIKVFSFPQFGINYDGKCISGLEIQPTKEKNNDTNIKALKSALSKRQKERRTVIKFKALINNVSSNASWFGWSLMF
jgi:hypothetical protein